MSRGKNDSFRGEKNLSLKMTFGDKKADFFAAKSHFFVVFLVLLSI